MKDLAPPPDPAKGITVATTQTGTISMLATGKNVDQIIPHYIQASMPNWFGLLFLLTLLAAAMSTISSQFHTMGTSIGRDFYEKGLRGGKIGVSSIGITRVGILAGIVMSVFLGYWLKLTYGGTGTEIIARGTAIFFALCAACFLPMYFGGLFTRRITRAGALWGMVVGFLVSAFWLLFMHAKESAALLLCQSLFGKPSLVAGKVTGFIIWEEVDALFVALPVSILVTILVSLVSRPPDSGHLDRCFYGPAQKRA